MGTRSLTIVEDEKGREIVTIYRQFDGYYDGHGKELADFLTGFTLVNGLRGDGPEKIANGLGCLAAQVVAHFKKEPGGIYLYPAGARDVGEEYVYVVSGVIGGEPTIKVDDYSGPASGFDDFIKSQAEAEDE